MYEIIVSTNDATNDTMSCIRPCEAKRRGRRHKGTEGEGGSHGDETEEVVKETYQRRRIKRGEGSDGAGGFFFIYKFHLLNKLIVNQ